MIFGVNPMAPMLSSLLDLQTPATPEGKWDPGRFRDIQVEQWPDKKVIALFTRNGGGNRECYGLDPCVCAGCAMKAITGHPNYIRDADDEFDSTYATIYFDVPEKFNSVVEELYDESAIKPMQRFENMLTNLRNKNVDDDVKRALMAAEGIFAAIQKASAAQDAAAEGVTDETIGDPCANCDEESPCEPADYCLEKDSFERGIVSDVD